MAYFGFQKRVLMSETGDLELPEGEVMAQWFNDLDHPTRELVTKRWGSKEFSDWAATLLLSLGGGVLLRAGLSQAERERFNRLLMQRRVRSTIPGHQPDLVERLYDKLHEHVATVVDKIDAHTGRHGTAAVEWLDGEVQEVQSEMSRLYKRLKN